MKISRFLLSLTVGLLALSASAQNRTVTGTVTDGANGDPVPFASIVVKGTSNWTTTDIDGKYAVEGRFKHLFLGCAGAGLGRFLHSRKKNTHFGY